MRTWASKRAKSNSFHYSLFLRFSLRFERLKTGLTFLASSANYWRFSCSSPSFLSGDLNMNNKLFHECWNELAVWIMLFLASFLAYAATFVFVALFVGFDETAKMSSMDKYIQSIPTKLRAVSKYLSNPITHHWAQGKGYRFQSWRCPGLNITFTLTKLSFKLRTDKI